MSNSLKLCPFCGNQPVSNKYGGYPYGFTIECKSCDPTQAFHGSPELAREAWNARAGTTVMDMTNFEQAIIKELQYSFNATTYDAKAIAGQIIELARKYNGLQSTQVISAQLPERPIPKSKSELIEIAAKAAWKINYPNGSSLYSTYEVTNWKVKEIYRRDVKPIVDELYGNIYAEE